MLSIVKAAGQVLLGSLISPSTAGDPQEELKLALMRIMQIIYTVASGFDRVFRDQRKAWQSSMQDVNNIGSIVRDTANWDQQNWQHLTDVILPHSLARLDGTIHKWADKKFLPRTFLQSKVWKAVVHESHTTYIFWQANHLWLHGFRQKGWPALQRWQGKYAEPQLKQLWALNPNGYPLEPVIIGKAAAYLHSPKGQTDLKNLTRLVVDESPQVWRHVETAALAILNAQYP